MEPTDASGMTQIPGWGDLLKTEQREAFDLWRCYRAALQFGYEVQINLEGMIVVTYQGVQVFSNKEPSKVAGWFLQEARNHMRRAQQVIALLGGRS